MTFGFSDGSRNYRKLLSVSGEVFGFHTRVIASIEWLNLVPRLRIGSAVIKSPKFSARSTASPLRFLQGALVTLVLGVLSNGALVFVFFLSYLF